MPKYNVKLKKREQVARDTMAFWFDMSGTEFSFRAGQFVDITLENPPHTDAEGNTRGFSIASSPNDRDELLITTRMRNTAFKNSLKEVPLGTQVLVDGPYGNFTLKKDASKLAVMIAGGIGITPMLSMITYAAENRLENRILLLYSNKTAEDAAFVSKLRELERLNKNFRMVAVLTREALQGYENGHITGETIKAHVGESFKNAVYYVSGPPAMVSEMRKALEGIGISEDDINTEEFSGY